MKRRTLLNAGALAAGTLLVPGVVKAAAAEPDADLMTMVRGEARRLMKTHAIPGMAVAVTYQGRHVFINEGVASMESRQPVTESTLFEVGSISKTYTGLLGGYALAHRSIALSDVASKYLEDLSGSALGDASLLALATYTAGGLPLQFPPEVTDYPSMLAYFQRWTPQYPAGTQRRYSNPSIGLFGLLVANSMREPFQRLIHVLLERLDLKQTFISVPPEKMQDYAYGYTKDGAPIRVSPGMLDAQAYGIKTCAADLIRFVNAHMQRGRLDPMLRLAMNTSLSGYYQVGPMRQGLGWESYEWPISIDRLLDGNSTQMALHTNPAVSLHPALSPDKPMYTNKSGSTNGFGAYVAFIPHHQVGIAMLANKNFPIPARVESAFRILGSLPVSL
ncbi:class C beta-lactamase [Bordetella sp. 02P26C-1]|uniref:class C beta-lactamase n=1 Tax=Bordetella sp. 02P26C-1 TaxID=2683195 RepID=UPI0013529BAA|nr:class C beta-lactamase [Bordetella sp. 02P26C-1]MVW78289.1 class C beta-lactamase [Bordetella sp. 02P26C-1]